VAKSSVVAARGGKLVRRFALAWLVYGVKKWNQEDLKIDLDFVRSLRAVLFSGNIIEDALSTDSQKAEKG